MPPRFSNVRVLIFGDKKESTVVSVILLRPISVLPRSLSSYRLICLLFRPPHFVVISSKQMGTVWSAPGIRKLIPQGVGSTTIRSILRLQL